jgi:hypothetical protein
VINNSGGTISFGQPCFYGTPAAQPARRAVPAALM